MERRMRLADLLKNPQPTTPSAEKRARLSELLAPPRATLADMRYTSVMQGYQPGQGWKPEYEQEPPLEAPMVSPDDLIGSGIGKAALTLGSLIGSQAIMRKAAGSNLPALAQALKNQQGAIVYHGSPHQFDKFDMSKIGTGEGAQAYGHGLYFAESPGVAKEYKRALSTPEVVLPDGSVVRPSAGSPEDQAKAWLEDAYANQSSAPYQYAQRGLRDLMKYEKNPAEYQKALDILAEWEAKGAAIGEGGALYKVDIPDEAIAKFLDWDKPLSQQAPEVQAYVAMKRKQMDYEFAKPSQEWGDLGAPAPSRAFMSDADIMRNFARSPEGTQEMRKMGIPGIRYLDGGSRGAGQGTSNFVVFDDAMPRILERNNQPTGLNPWKPGEWQR